MKKWMFYNTSAKLCWDEDTNRDQLGNGGTDEGKPMSETKTYTAKTNQMSRSMLLFAR